MGDGLYLLMDKYESLITHIWDFVLILGEHDERGVSCVKKLGGVHNNLLHTPD